MKRGFLNEHSGGRAGRSNDDMAAAAKAQLRARLQARRTESQSSGSSAARPSMYIEGPDSAHSGGGLQSRLAMQDLLGDFASALTRIGLVAADAAADPRQDWAGQARMQALGQQAAEFAGIAHQAMAMNTSHIEMRLDVDEAAAPARSTPGTTDDGIHLLAVDAMPQDMAADGDPDIQDADSDTGRTKST